MKKFRKNIGILALCTASAIGGYAGFNFVKDVQFARAEQKVESTREQLAQVEDLASVFREVGRVLEPSVVNISVTKTVHGVSHEGGMDDDMLRRFFPDRDGDGEPDVPPGFRMPGQGEEDQEQSGTGSGVIVELDGKSAFIVTNNHVAGDATELKVTLSDGREINGTLVGTDPKTDIAVVKIEADHLIAAKWGNSDDVQKGDWVLAFGSPFGYIGSMTHGIVSALNRDVGILRQQMGYENFIQVDAPINPGNSGGPLVNVRGEIIGINTAIATRSGGFQGIGFAIPSNQAQVIYKSLKETGKVTRGWLGVEIANVSAIKDEAKAVGYESDKGVMVKGAMRGTPAAGKLQPGDIITRINGKVVDNVTQLRNVIAMTAPGTDVQMTVFRSGKEADVTVKVGEQPDDMASGGRPGRNPGVAPPVDALGMTLGTVNEETIQQFGLNDVSEGAVITEVKRGSSAARAGLKPGDVITRVGDTLVTNAEGAAGALREQDRSKGIRLNITSAEGQRFVFVRPDKVR